MGEGRVSLLIVDDNASQRMALAAILADLGVDLVEASSGREALRLLLRQEFAIIILDVNMPGLDGFETAALIRARRSSERTPIIFITAGGGDDSYPDRGYSLGAVDYITTPVRANVLRSKVSVFIDLYRKTQEVERQRQSMQRYASRLQLLSRASLAINSARSVEDLLEVVATNAGHIIEARQAGTSALLADRTAMAVTYLCDGDGDERITRDGGPPARFAIAVPQRLTHADLERRARDTSPAEIVAGRPLRGWLAAPLTGHEGATLGIVQVSDKKTGEFTGEDESILVQLAQMASVAIQNAHAAEAREANRLKDEFLGVLSHELRTPLQAMLTWISILRTESVDPATLRRGLDVIERSARSQGQLIGDLLDISRIIRGQLQLQTGPVDLASAIDLALETLKPAVAASQIELVWHPAVVGHIVGDAGRLQQVVWNLVSNAIKFSGKGGRVEIQLSEEADAVEIRVLDSGSGIPEGFLPHLFERFRQAESGSSRQHGGLGLGLAIVRHLVELHGGSVRALNAEGAGALFIVRLPRDDSTEDRFSGASAGLAAGSAASKGTRLDDIRVVLVEDDGDAREAMVAALELFGAQVVAVDSAAAALKVLEERTPDVLLSDIGMAGEDGYSLIRKLRAREAEGGGHLPAAAVSAYVRAEDSADMLRAGFDSHLRKPVEPFELAKVVRALVRRI